MLLKSAMRLRQSGLVTASQTLETAFPTSTRRKSRSQMRAIVCLALSLGVQLTLNFGFERTHVLTRMNSNELEQMFSPDFEVWGMLSKTKDAWHTSYVCTHQKTNTSNNWKNKFSNGRRGRFLPPAPFLQLFLIFLSYSLKWLHHLVCSMLRVDLCYCARVHVLSIHCTVMDPIPKHARRTQSWVQRSRMLSNCVSPAAQDVGSRNHTVMYNHVHVHDCTCTTYTSQFELEYESTFLFLNEYLNFRSFHPKFSHTGF